jgi:hypothetical protein
MSPLAGRRPDDQLSLRRASVPSGNPFGPAPGVQPEEQPGVERSMPYVRDLTLRGQHSPVRRACRPRRSVGPGTWQRGSSSLRKARWSRYDSGQHLHQSFRLCRPDLHVGAKWWDWNKSPPGALAPAARSPRSPENAMAHFVQQNETPRHPAEAHGPNLASTSPGRLHR